MLRSLHPPECESVGRRVIQIKERFVLKGTVHATVDYLSVHYIDR